MLSNEILRFLSEMEINITTSEHTIFSFHGLQKQTSVNNHQKRFSKRVEMQDACQKLCNGHLRVAVIHDITSNADAILFLHKMSGQL